MQDINISVKTPTQPNITLVGLDTKMTLQTPPLKLNLAASKH